MTKPGRKPKLTRAQVSHTSRDELAFIAAFYDQSMRDTLDTLIHKEHRSLLRKMKREKITPPPGVKLPYLNAENPRP